MHGDDIHAGQGYEMYYSTWRSKERFPALHVHDFYEVYLFFRGEASYIVEDYAHDLMPGDLVIIPPGKFHRAAFSDLNAPYERLLVYISADAMRAMHFGGFSISERLDAMAQTGAYFHPLSPEDAQSWLRCYQEATGQSQRPSQPLLTLCQLSILLTRLCDACQEDAEILPATGVIGPIIRYINEHYREALTLEHLSRQFYMTPVHLSHLFRRHARLSVHQYITAKRMMLARSLLLQGASPQEVSVQCGYQDYSSFYRAFTKAEGTPPRAYQSHQG